MGTRHLQFWPRGTTYDFTLPETSLWYNLDVSATRFPNKNALVFYDGTITYRQLKEQAEALAGYLQRHCGVARGDRVGLYMQNSPQFVIGFYAILRAGGMAVPFNPMSVTAEVDYLARDSGAQVVLASQELYPNVEPLLGTDALKHAVVATYSDYIAQDTDLTVPEFVTAPRLQLDNPHAVSWQHVLDLALEPGPDVAGPDDLCVMPYTSGTTGRPKGCVHTHRSVMQTTMLYTQWRAAFQDDCVLSVVPLFHVTGMQNAMNGPILAGSTIVLLPRWDRDVAAALIARYKVTGWISVPTMVVDLLSSPRADEYDLSSLRGMGGGGAAMPEAIATKLHERCGLDYVEGYGLSETMAATHVNPHDHPKKQCLGIPTFGVDSRVVNPKTLEELPPGEIGEIVTHGPQVFQGYWNRPEANAECFVEIDGKRFFRTGDLGRTDEEGYFFLVDRLKRMINAAGYKVWPAEVESLIYEHEAVQEVAIISKRDPRRGETVKAVAVLKPGKSLGEDELIAWCRQRMAAYKVPRSVDFVEALPKSGSGKIQWRELQEREDRRAAERAAQPAAGATAGV